MPEVVDLGVTPIQQVDGPGPNACLQVPTHDELDKRTAS